MDTLITALDIGTSKIRAAAGIKTQETDPVNILKIEETDSEETVKRGKIFNSDQASAKIRTLLNNLNFYLKGHHKSSLEKIYVGIGGESIHTEELIIKEAVDGESVTDSLLKNIQEQAENYTPELYRVLKIFEPDYYLDGTKSERPLGAAASEIEARFMLVVGNPSAENVIKTIVERTTPIAEIYISPLATAEEVLTATEKSIGCALVELGAGVTTVSIYKDKKLKFLFTIPLGSAVITKDLLELNLAFEEAEKLKKEYGSAILDSETDRQVDLDALRAIKISDLNDIIEARLYEILSNVFNQIKLSGYENTLGAGIVLTGGGALLQDLQKYTEDEWQMKVRIAEEPELSCINGLMRLGKESCGKWEKVNTVQVEPPKKDEVTEEKNTPPEPKTPWWKTIEKKLDPEPEDIKPKEIEPVIEQPKKPNIFKRAIKGGKEAFSGMNDLFNGIE